MSVDKIMKILFIWGSKNSKFILKISLFKFLASSFMITYFTLYFTDYFQLQFISRAIVSLIPLIITIVGGLALLIMRHSITQQQAIIKRECLKKD